MGLVLAVSAGVTGGDPLAALASVPWAGLQHCYGMADDVPGLLRAMRAGDWEGRYSPGLQLANRIVHQGTRSQAAVFAIPFLVQMALDPRVADQQECVALLGAIAIGLDNNYLPNGYDPREARDYLEMLRGEAGNHARWIAEAASDEQRRDREASCAQVLIDAEADVRCYDAVRDALPALVALLNADRPGLRAETANLLAWFPELAATSVPLLTAFVTREASPGAAATGLVGLGLLGDPQAVPFIRGYLGSAIPELRWASAFALTRFGITGQVVIDALKETAAKPPAPSETMSFLSGSYRKLTELVLREITPSPS